MDTQPSKTEVKLRDAREEDVPWIAATESRPEFHTFVGCWTEEQHRRAMQDADVLYRMAYVPQEDGEERCGFVILRGLALPHRNIQLKRFVVAQPGHGMGQAILRDVMRFAFEDKGAHRLWLDVFPTNARALHLYRKHGFQQDGIFREAVYRDGEYHSLLLLCILDREYRSLQREASAAQAD